MTASHFEMTNNNNGSHVYLHGESQCQSFLNTWQRGRVHHAWLLCGPKGMGKALFAQSLANFVLAERRETLTNGLIVPHDDPALHWIAAGAHPDLFVLHPDSGKKNISVDQIRGITESFQKSPARARYRVAILDAADDLNLNSSNALLKSLEEPPERGIWFIVCHNPGRILSTIRSRCRVLNFRPWPDSQVRDFLAQRLDNESETLDQLTLMAEGVPGRGMQLHADGVTRILSLAQAMVSSAALPAPEGLKMALEFRQGGGQRGDAARKFKTLLTCIKAVQRQKALSAPSLSHAQAYIQAWEAIERAEAEIDTLNMDRFDYFYALLETLKTKSSVLT